LHMLAYAGQQSAKYKVTAKPLLTPPRPLVFFGSNGGSQFDVISASIT
jgi:hypothetical protein